MKIEGSVGRRIAQLRAEKGQSQEALAKAANLSRKYLSQIEREKATNLSVNVLGRLAMALDVSISKLMEGADHGDYLIPSALREFAIEQGLTYESTQRLIQIPKPGLEPNTPAEWRKLYQMVRRYIED